MIDESFLVSTVVLSDSGAFGSFARSAGNPEKS